MHAVRVIAAGDALLAPSVTRRLIAGFARQPPATPPPAALGALTSRETEVLQYGGRVLDHCSLVTSRDSASPGAAPDDGFLRSR